MSKQTKRKKLTKRLTKRKLEYKMLFKEGGVDKAFAKKFYVDMARPRTAKIVKLPNGKYNIKYKVYRFLPVDPNWRPQE